jgi:hypothetical protein
VTDGDLGSERDDLRAVLGFPESIESGPEAIRRDTAATELTGAPAMTAAVGAALNARIERLDTVLQRLDRVRPDDLDRRVEGVEAGLSRVAQTVTRLENSIAPLATAVDGIAAQRDGGPTRGDLMKVASDLTQFVEERLSKHSEEQMHALETLVAALGDVAEKLASIQAAVCDVRLAGSGGESPVTFDFESINRRLDATNERLAALASPSLLGSMAEVKATVMKTLTEVRVNKLTVESDLDELRRAVDPNA